MAIDRPMLPGLPEPEPIDRSHINVRGHLRARAHARRTDPETSHEAAESVTNLTSKQAAVLEMLKNSGPMCDEQIFDALWDAGFKMSPSGARTRRDELVGQGLLEFSGRYVTLRSGRRSRVWKSTS